MRRLLAARLLDGSLPRIWAGVLGSTPYRTLSWLPTKPLPSPSGL